MSGAHELLDTGSFGSTDHLISCIESLKTGSYFVSLVIDLHFPVSLNAWG